MNSVVCFAHGQDGQWEALCVDFDIAVHGRSFEEVQKALNEAIWTYVEDAEKESPSVRKALLNRRSPWHVRFLLTTRLAFYNFFHGRRGLDQASFPVLCHV